MEFECQDNFEEHLGKKIVVQNPVIKHLGRGQFYKPVGNKCKLKEAAKPGCFVQRLESGCNKVSEAEVCPILVKTDEGSSDCHRSITDLPLALISEIFKCLDPTDLGIVSCVSTVLCKIASDHHVWKDFYCERWSLPLARSVSTCLAYEKTWKELFVEKEFRTNIFLGHYRPDYLIGHKEAVRTVFLLASAKLIFSAGYDSVVRVWGLEDGVPIDSSRCLGCTIRAIAADTRLLVVGGTDGFILCWKAVDGVSHLFDLKGYQSTSSNFRLQEHEGPITCLALDLTRIYSGSWDMTVRVWDRSQLQCIAVLRHSDWVWSIVPNGSTIASTSGSDVYIWDTIDGIVDAVIPHCHAGYTYALARSHSGDFLFTGGEDGCIRMFDVSICAEDVVKVATWKCHSGPVNSLAFEFPWLVSASTDGKLSLINVKKLLKTSRQRTLMKRIHRTHAATVEPPQRMLHGSGASFFAVDIGADRIVCGGEDCVVKVWDFSLALERDMRSRAQKAIRLESKMRQRRHQAEMSSTSGRADKCSVVATKDSVTGDGAAAWHNKRGVGKVKA